MLSAFPAGGLAAVPFAQTISGLDSDTIQAWIAAPVFYVGFGLSLSILALLIVILAWRSEHRRMRSGLRILSEAATQLADQGEYSAVGIRRNHDLAVLADAFNRISEATGAQRDQLADCKARLGKIQDYINRFQASTGRLSEIREQSELQEALVRTLIESFGYQRANLWLLHRFVKRQGLRPESAKPASTLETDTQNVLDKVGLLPACRSVELQSAPNQKPGRPAYRGILEVAMTNEEVCCPDISESILFDGAVADLKAEGLVSYLAIPLFERGQLIGVVEAFGAEEPSGLDIQLLRLFSSRAASLISMLNSGEEMAQSREASEVKNLELQMANRRLQRINVRLEESDRLKSEFLANTSHELRTPLNSILGFTQLILAGACDSQEEVESNVRSIQESGERLLRLINEVLDLAKIEAGRMGLALSPLDVRPVIDAAVSLLRVQAESKGVQLLVEGKELEGVLIRADHTKLYQILVNLLGNAVKFTEKGRVITRIVPEKVPGFMTLEVEDTGIGITPDVLSRLFHNFVQGDGSVTRKFGGTGLGLSISQKLADLQGGALELASQGEGRGAVATLMLPLWSDELETDAEHPAAENRTPTDPARTIVVIEDYLEFQQYLVDILEDRGWQTLTARTAREGLELIQEHGPSAVVLDMHLPWDETDSSIRSGYDVVSVLGRDPELNALPILIVTGMLRKTADRLLSQTVLNPVELYGKPLNEEAFFESLDRLTSRGRRLSSSGS